MLDRLAGDEQTLGDLRVRETLGEKPQHFLLALGESPEVLRSRPGCLHTQLSKKGRRIVGVTTGAEVFEDRECGAGFGRRELDVDQARQPRDRQASLSDAVGNLSPPEGNERGLEVGAPRGWIAAGRRQTQKPSSVSDDEVAVIGVAERDEVLPATGGLVGLPERDLGLPEQVDDDSSVEPVRANRVEATPQQGRRE